MEDKEYFNFVLGKLIPELNKTEKDKVDNSVLGLCGEAGEIADYFKKVKYQGHPFNKEKILEESGDVLFYLTLLLGLYGYTPTDARKFNINKLNERYMGSATVEESINRVK